MTENKTISNLLFRWNLRVAALMVSTIVISAIVLWWALSQIDLAIMIKATVTAGSIAIIASYFSTAFGSRKKLIRLVNEQVNELEYSTELLEREPVNSLEHLQQQRMLDRLEYSHLRVRFPANLLKAGIAISASIIIAVGITSFGLSETNGPNESADRIAVVQKETTETQDTVFLKDIKMIVTPPAYTGLGTSSSSQSNLSVPEGSTIRILPVFSQPPEGSWLSTSDQDSIPFTANDLSLRPEKDLLISVGYLDADGKTRYSDYKRIDIRPDQKPSIEIAGLREVQNVSYTEVDDLDFSLSVEDDYSLTDLYVVATIAKGSGESIKFREQRLDIAKGIDKSRYSSAYSIPVTDFGMEPGNELYFYIAAEDNKVPEANLTRSETFFYIVQDTAEVEFTLQGNLGVDIMPEFFRSQLQIIMDSEQLLKDRPALSKEEFNKRSNNLAFDQKQLRLKYGQFIGEESESGLAATSTEEISEDIDADNVLSEFGHDHDHENEEGQLLDKGTEPHDHDHDHDHDHGEGDLTAETEEDPLEEFIHTHEDREMATFYGQSLKGKLRAALAEMWDAELHLRMYDPATSLPYQRKAYKLIKEIRNHARVYVKRIGFDPPAINKQEARLQKDPEDINKEPFSSNQLANDDLIATRLLLNTLAQKPPIVNTENNLKSQFEAVAQEVSALAVQKAALLEELMILNRLINVETFGEEEVYNLKLLKRSLSSLLRAPYEQPASDVIWKHPVMTRFTQELTKE